MRVARALASPIGVLVTLPLLVVAVGMGILLLGRDATRTSSQTMARHQLAEQAQNVRNEIALALDQAEPLFAQLALLADPTRPMEDVLVRLHDLLIARPGLAYLSLSFPDGMFRGAYLTPEKVLEVQQSRVVEHDVQKFVVENGMLRVTKTEVNEYDPRTRGFYQLAARMEMRAWTPPYTFFKSHDTGITCTEPLFDSSGVLRAVLTVDFDVGSLSPYVTRAALDQARSFMFTREGIVLAFPAGGQLPPSEGLLRYGDLKDPALDAIFARGFGGNDDRVEFFNLDTREGAYLASVASVGGKRAGVSVPLDWFVATVVPANTLLGATHMLERSSFIASGGALAIAVGLSLVLAWNLVRMRQQVIASRAEARTAEARARELGSYRLVAKLGTGGMGEVWRAEHRLLARQAAIKLIRPEVLGDPRGEMEVRERFRREAQTLASMKSRHTIEIYDYGVTAEGVFYYVMELLDGLDFESLVVRYGAQPPARVIKLLVQACSSLGEAHAAGLYHRDIKPPNLFISRAADEVDITKLLDFGIVQTMHEPPATAAKPVKPISETPKLTQIGAMLGTPGFMAPEQILGMMIDGRADIYALGCCAWWLLTGREVFARDGGESKVLHRHMYDAIPSLRTQVKGWCPSELEDVITACLAKEAEDRPPDAAALADALRAIPVSAEYEWTSARAHLWWSAYQPPTPAPPVPSDEVKVIVAGRTGHPKPIEPIEPTQSIITSVEKP